MDNAQRFTSIAVIGAGAWGTALAALCARNGVKTLVWAREEEVAKAINETGENPAFLPKYKLPQTLSATYDLGMAAEQEAILFVVPAQFARPVFGELRMTARDNAPVALCSKGIEKDTGLLMTEVLAEVWPHAKPAVLSGPSFAKDVVKGLPTAVTLACADPALGARWAATLSAPTFRPYLSDDLTGAELGGAIKNVLAVAAGVVDGKGLGESARAALIARGFAEFQRIGEALGAKPQTMAGLSGLGDLDPHRVLLPVPQHVPRDRAWQRTRPQKKSWGERNSVSEGAASASAVIQLARKADVDAPICEAVAALINGERNVDEIIADLLSRPIKSETK